MSDRKIRDLERQAVDDPISRLELVLWKRRSRIPLTLAEEHFFWSRTTMSAYSSAFAPSGFAELTFVGGTLDIGELSTKTVLCWSGKVKWPGILTRCFISDEYGNRLAESEFIVERRVVDGDFIEVRLEMGQIRFLM